jgi:hypothetical protein
MLSFRIVMPAWNAEHAAAIARLELFPWRPVSAVRRLSSTQFWGEREANVAAPSNQAIIEKLEKADVAAETIV